VCTNVIEKKYSHKTTKYMEVSTTICTVHYNPLGVYSDGSVETYMVKVSTSLGPPSRYVQHESDNVTKRSKCCKISISVFIAEMMRI